MTPEIIEQWTKAAHGALAAAKSWSDLSLSALERVTAQQLELAQLNVETTVRAGQLLGESKSYNDFATGQAALVHEFNDKVTKVLKRSNELASELRFEYASWTEGQLRTAVAPFNKPVDIRVA